MLRLTAIFFFLLTSIASATTTPETICQDTLTQILLMKEMNPDRAVELFRAIDTAKIHWKEIFDFVDPGKVEKNRPAFPSRADLLKYFGVADPEDAAGVHQVEMLLTRLGVLFLHPENLSKVDASSVPEIFVSVEKAELVKGQVVTRLEALRRFILDKLLYLSANPSRAVSIAMLDLDKTFGQEITTGALRRLEGVGNIGRRMWRNKGFLFHPILSLRILWNAAVYRYRRHLVNGNSHHSAQSHSALEKLAFLMENAELRRKEAVGVSDLPLNFQADLLKEFGDDRISEQLASGKPGPLSIDREHIDVTVFAALTDGVAPKQAPETLKESVDRFRRTFDENQEFFRKLLFEDLEATYKALQAALQETDSIGAQTRVALAKAAPPIYRWPIDQWIFNKTFKGRALRRLKDASQKFAAVYLQALAVTDPLHRAMPTKYFDAFEGNPFVKLQGEILLAEAEKAAKKGDLTTRTRLAEEALRNFAASPLAWASVNNPSALAAQFLQQVFNAGFFQNPKVEKTTLAAGSLGIMLLMISWPYLMRPSEDSPLEATFGTRTTLTDDIKFQDAKWSFYERVRIHGISSADKFVLDEFFAEEDIHRMPTIWQERFQKLKKSHHYGNFSSIFSSQFPRAAQWIRQGQHHFYRDSGAANEWDGLKAELDETLDLMREKRALEMKQLDALKKIREQEDARKAKATPPGQNSALPIKP